MAANFVSGFKLHSEVFSAVFCTDYSDLALRIFLRRHLVLAGASFLRDDARIDLHLIPMEHEWRGIVADERSREANPVVLLQANDVRLRRHWSWAAATWT